MSMVAMACRSATRLCVRRNVHVRASLGGSNMQLDKAVIDLPRKEGKNEHVQKALQELPQKIDHESTPS
jgi:hypothetical protein